MKKYAFLILGLVFFLSGQASFFWAGETVKVGIYQDEPLVLIDERGNPRGFCIDILGYIASKEGWKIEYVVGSQSQCFERLEKGEVDLLAGIPYSDRLKEKYNFTGVSLLSNWAQLYTQKDSEIESVFDLEGKSIAGVKGDIYYEGFKSLMQSFTIKCNFVDLDNDKTVFRFLSQKLADAGVVDRIYGMQHEEDYKIDRSEITCYPAELRFALSKFGDGKFKKAIDEDMASLKKNRNSVYYQSLDKWFEGIRRWIFPQWLIWVLMSAVVALFIFLARNRTLRDEVKTKVKELTQRNEEFGEEITERKRVHEKLITTLVELEQRVKDRTAELSESNELLRKEITERKQAEENLRKTAVELERSNKELEEYAYVASHDLQEPLRMVSSYLKLLAERYKEKLDKDAGEFIAYAADGAARMKKLVDSLLAYSRVGAQGIFEPIDCSAVLGHALENLKVAIEKNGVSITHDSLPEVTGDATLLTELFQNLIGNAVKFRGELPSRIHIGAEQKQNEWLFSIKDNGIGIDPQNFERIFLLFQRLHTRDEYPGVGIGLAVCKKIVEQHGGRIWVESQQGQGSTFYFTFPVRKK